MSISNNDYSKMTDKASPNSPIALDCLMAFLFGGGICCFGQILLSTFYSIGLNDQQARLLMLSIIIVITAILTGFGVFDKIAKIAGAGTIVPISGFANSVVSPALEFKHEGFVLGTGAQMFTIAGPVIVYGCATSVVYGLIIYFFNLY